MIDLQQLIKDAFDNFIRSVPSLPGAIRVVVRNQSTVSFEPGRHGSNDHVIVGDNITSQINRKDITEYTSDEIREFVTSQLGSALGFFFMRERAESTEYLKSFMDSNYKKQLFDVLNRLRVRANTEYFTGERPMGKFIKELEMSHFPAIQIADYWWLFGESASTDDAVLQEILLEVMNTRNAAELPKFVNKMVELYPAANDNCEPVYREALIKSENLNSGEKIVGGESKEVASSDGHTGVGYTDSYSINPGDDKESAARKFDSSSTPPDVESMPTRYRTDHWEKSIFKRTTPKFKDTARVEKVIHLLSSVFKNTGGMDTTRSPTRNLDTQSLANACMGIDIVRYKRPVLMARAPIEMDMIIDCSGSMSSCIRDCRVFMLAFHYYARQGFLKGRIYFTSGEGYTVKSWETITEDELLSFDAYSGSEGIRDCLRDMWTKMRSANMVCAYTDACITDGGWNKEEYQSKGVSIVGLYVGDDSARPEMLKYFSVARVQPTVEQLTEELIYQFKKMPIRYNEV